jgi:hypothetical protein
MDGKEIVPVNTEANIAPILQSPQEIVDDAAEKAKVLRDVVKQADLAKKFGGKKEHLEFEAWQTIGKFYGCTPVTEWTKPIYEGEKIIGWEARVLVADSEGRTVAAAENMCMRDEPNWKGKPNYALRSMAQTRTGSKALRSVFAFVAVLAGYSATPSEEMIDAFNKPTNKKKQTNLAQSEGRVTSGPTDEDPLAPLVDNCTKKQFGMMVHLAKENGLTKEELEKLAAWYRDGEKLKKWEASEMINIMGEPEKFQSLVEDYMMDKHAQEGPNDQASFKSPV